MTHSDSAGALHHDFTQFFALHRMAFAATGGVCVVVATGDRVSLWLEHADPKKNPHGESPTFDSRHAVLAWTGLTERAKTFAQRCAQLATPLLEAPAGFVMTLSSGARQTFGAGWVPYGCQPSKSWASSFVQPRELDGALLTLPHHTAGTRLWSLQLSQTVHEKAEVVVRAADVHHASLIFGSLFGATRQNRHGVVEAFLDVAEPDVLDTEGDSRIADVLYEALRAARVACKRWEPTDFTTASLTVLPILDAAMPHWVTYRPLGWKADWDTPVRGGGFDTAAGLEARALLLEAAACLDALPFLAYGSPLALSMTLVPGGEVLARMGLGDARGNARSPNFEEMEAGPFLRAWRPVLAGLEHMQPAQAAWRVRTGRWDKGLCLGAASRGQALAATQLLLGTFHRPPTLHRIPSLLERGMTLDEVRLPVQAADA